VSAGAAEHLERALATLRHSRYGYYGAALRDQLLHALPDEVGEVSRLHYRVLRFVEADTAGTATVSHVAEVLLCDRARASRVVRRLVDAGLLELRTPPHDARQRRLRLAPAGRRLLAEAAAARHAHLLAVLREWDEQDVGTLARLLERLGEDAGRHLVPPPRPLP